MARPWEEPWLLLGKIPTRYWYYPFGKLPQWQQMKAKHVLSCGKQHRKLLKNHETSLPWDRKHLNTFLSMHFSPMSRSKCELKWSFVNFASGQRELSTILVLSEGIFQKALSPALHSEVAKYWKSLDLISTKVLMKHKRQHTHTHIHTNRNSFSCTDSFQQIGYISFYQIANILLDHRKSREFWKTSTSISEIDYVNPLTMWIISNCGKLLKIWAYQTTLSISQKPLCGSKSNS